MITFNVEYTDTFGGEANYSWVRKETLTVKTDSQRAIVRAAKAFCGFTGMPARVESYGDMISIKPYNLCQMAFVTFDYD